MNDFFGTQAQEQQIWGSERKRAVLRRKCFCAVRDKCPEKLLRAVLKKMSRTYKFIPARTLRSLDFSMVSLEEMLQPINVPWFKFEDVRLSDNKIEVDVSHGIPMAALGETFIYRIVERNEPIVRLIKRYETWIS